jgi:hypothetical protein
LRIQHFARTGSSKNEKLKGTGGEGFMAAKPVDKRRNVAVWHGGKVATSQLAGLWQHVLKIAAPHGRIFTLPPSLHLGKVQYPFEPSANGNTRLQGSTDRRELQLRLALCAG